MLVQLQPGLSGSAVGSVVFGALLTAVCVSDLRTRRIPNALVLTIALTGVAYSVATASPLVGLGRALGGLAVGLAIWFPFYLLRMLGAGDVKFFAAACAWLGPSLGWRAALLTAVAGGLLGLLWLIAGVGIRRASAALAIQAALPRFNVAAAYLPEERRRQLPYGVAMVIGVAVTAWWPRIVT